MASDVRQLTRNELAIFLPNQRAISAFENLFNVPNSVDANTQEISDANLNSAAAEAKAQIALDTVSATKVIADNAQASANTAQASANAAQISANAAQVSADQALIESSLLILAPPLVM